MENKKLTYLSLFSGVGGLEEGFIENGVTPIAHVEMDTNACFTLKTRLAYHYLKNNNLLIHYNNYLKKNISRDELYSYIPKNLIQSVINLDIGDKNNQTIYNKIDDLLGEKEVTFLLGGPPCQAYSLIGRAKDKNKMKGDPRNLLYLHYGRYLNKYKPKYFVFENVLGLLSANEGKFLKNMMAYFKRIGYYVEYKRHDTSEYGVLQKRKRLIIVGWRKDVEFSYPDFKKIKINNTIKDILYDLPKLKPGEEKHICKYTKPTNEYLSSFNLRNGLDFVTQHVTRSHNDRDLKIYKIAISKWLDKGVRVKYPDIPEELKTHKNQKSFVDRFKVVDVNGYSHTLVAHISKDGHHYIYPDKKQIRSLSVREAARIQSFPDNYYFEGGRTAAFKQIGNAVPPIFSKIIAKEIIHKIEIE